MKRIIALTFAAALLLTGCGQVNEKVGKEMQGSDTQITDNTQITGNNDKAVTEIKITEIGGEDGRDNEWIVSKADDCNVVVQKDNRFGKTVTYHISDEDYQILMNIDFSPFIGKKEDAEGVADWVFYTIRIAYSDATEDKAEVYITELWNKLYEIITEYEPVEIITNDEPFPESGNIGEYTYKIINSKGNFEADFSGAGKYDKCFYLEEENRPDSPLRIYIYGGEYSHGGYFMDVTGLKIKNDTLYITVNEGLVEAEVYTQAFMTTGCMVEISPNVSNVKVKNTGGYEFKQIEKSSKPSEGELYFKEPEADDVVFDKENGVSYVKNQLLISVSPDTERSEVVEMLSNGDYGEVQIVGEITLTGDYQVEFSEDKSLSELQEIADYYLMLPFVENVTLNFVENITLNTIEETAPDELEEDWIAKLSGGVGEIMYHTYVYKT